MRAVERDWGIAIRDFPALWDWSVAEPAKFWQSLWSFAGVIAESRGETVLLKPDDILNARFFPEARLNFAENLLRRRDHADAIVFRGENGVLRRVSFGELYATVARLSAGLKSKGVRAGDRIAGVMPCMPEAIVAMLAAASIGAIWSSCSPDFGEDAIFERFGQIAPKVLIGTDGYFYNGKSYDCLAKLAGVAARIRSVESVIVVPFVEEAPALPGPNAISLADFLADREVAEIDFAQLPFDHPLYILYSSGTTGPPKCIVHGAGGTLLQHLKEHRLHCDIKRSDRVFYFTTCGWMMWNWLASVLASEATVLLFDGSPLYPEPGVLFEYAAREGMTFFGTSAKYIESISKSGLRPGASHSLENLRTIASTGSPLSPAGFEFVYEHIKKDVCLSSISGGTDIVSCFVLGNPIGPVWSGEIQTRGLGMKVEIFDDGGSPVQGLKGELVCTAPFPSRPLGFWNDANGEKYRAAYFDRFPNVWCHGDYAELTGHGGVIIHGRSDATLKPGGVRIGTAEIYREVERLDEVVESVAVGQDWAGDVRVILFVRLRGGVALDEALAKKIKTQIRRGCSPRHVPAKIIEVLDIPRTKSGKIVELAVRDVIHGRAVKNAAALANPEALDLFRDLPELKT
jgi:acetoacetyl-CoA synthetase